MINKSLPFKGFNVRIPSRIPIKGREFINQGSGLRGSRWCRISSMHRTVPSDCSVGRSGTGFGFTKPTPFDTPALGRVLSRSLFGFLPKKPLISEAPAW